MLKAQRNKAGILCFWMTEYQKDYKSPLEHVEQQQLVTHSKYQWPNESKLMLHPANEGDVSVQYRSKLKKGGLLKGASDWIILHPAGDHPYMVLELKRANKKQASTISNEQKEFLLATENVEAFACVAYGFEAGIAAMQFYFNNY